MEHKTKSAVAGKRNDANFDVKAANLPGDNATKPPANTISKWAKPRHKKIANALGFALILGNASAWCGFTISALARLTEKECCALAVAVLRALTPEQVLAVAETVLPQGAGMPIAPLFSHMDEAAFWADMAEPAELDAYCLACFNGMAPARQAAFLDFVQGRAAA